jgi:hypothetical protein
MRGDQVRQQAPRRASPSASNRFAIPTDGAQLQDEGY